MKEKIKKFLTLRWLLESNRPMHIIIALFIGLFLGLEAVIAAAAAAEFKDWMWCGQQGGAFGWVKGNGFDWLDFTASMLGGLIGWVVRILLFQ